MAKQFKGFKFSQTHFCQATLLLTQSGSYQHWRKDRSESETDLVPVAVMLSGMAVILQNLGDGALIDALQTELPLSQLQETSM